MVLVTYKETDGDDGSEVILCTLWDTPEYSVVTVNVAKGSRALRRPNFSQHKFSSVSISYKHVHFRVMGHERLLSAKPILSHLPLLKKQSLLPIPNK